MDGVKRALNDKRMDVREASERARNRNEWQTIVTLMPRGCLIEAILW